MPLHLVLAVTVVVAVAFYVSIFNPLSINFNLTRDLSYEVPLVVIVLAAIFIGSLLVALMDAVKASRQGISKLHASVQNKRSRRLHQPHERGMHYLEVGYLTEAEKEFEKVLEKDPKHVPTLIELGKLKSAKGDYDEALKLHNRALMLDNRSPEAAFCLAESYARKGRYQKALNVLQNVKDSAPHELVVLAEMRKVCMEGGLWEDALKVQNEIVRHTRDKEPAEKERDTLHGIQYEVGSQALKNGRFNQALKEFKSILKSQPDFTPAHAGAGDAYLAMGKDAEAVKAWEAGYGATSDTSLLQKQEDLFMGKEDPASAIALYKTALEARPEAVSLNYLLGLVYLKLEMMDEALQEFKRVRAAGMTAPGMGALIAGIYERTGEQDLAALEYSRERERLEQSMALYRCASCGASSRKWRGRCSSCGEWNKLRMNMEEESSPSEEKVMPPPTPGF